MTKRLLTEESALPVSVLPDELWHAVLSFCAYREPGHALSLLGVSKATAAHITPALVAWLLPLCKPFIRVRLLRVLSNEALENAPIRLCYMEKGAPLVPERVASLHAYMGDRAAHVNTLFGVFRRLLALPLSPQHMSEIIAVWRASECSASCEPHRLLLRCVDALAPLLTLEEIRSLGCSK